METVKAGRSEPWYMLDNAEACLVVLRDVNSGYGRRRSRHRSKRPSRRKNLKHWISRLSGNALWLRRRQMLCRAKRKCRRLRSCLCRSWPRTPSIWIPSSSRYSSRKPSRKSRRSNGIFRPGPPRPTTWRCSSRCALVPHAQRQRSHGRSRAHWRVCLGGRNLLNRLINRTLKRTPPMLDFVLEAAAAVPELIEQLEVGSRATLGYQSPDREGQCLCRGRPECSGADNQPTEK